MSEVLNTLTALIYESARNIALFFVRMHSDYVNSNQTESKIQLKKRISYLWIWWFTCSAQLCAVGEVLQS